jgi:hypothetical protein
MIFLEFTQTHRCTEAQPNAADSEQSFNRALVIAD